MKIRNCVIIGMMCASAISSCEEIPIVVSDFTISGRVISPDVPAQFCTIDFYTASPDFNGRISYKPFGSTSIDSEGNYKFQYNTKGVNARAIFAYINDAEENEIMKLEFPFMQDIDHDFNISETRVVMFKLISSNPLQQSDTLFFRVDDYFPSHYIGGVPWTEKGEYQYLVGPVNNNDVFEMTLINGQRKNIGWSTKSQYFSPLDTTYRDTIVLFAENLDLDTINIEYINP